MYQKNGELHVWAGQPNGLYCLIHSDSSYLTLCQVAGRTPMSCLRRDVERRDGDGKLHCEDGPAQIKPDGTQKWFRHGWLHRDDGPAAIMPNGTQAWYQHGKRHRDDGPAVIMPDGTQQWYQRGKQHRDDGPAVIGSNGTQSWYQHGELHREDGPAVVWCGGVQEWYWHDEEVTEEEHTRLRKYSGTQKAMAGICNFPISPKRRCTQPVADGRPNCGRHSTNLSASQLGQKPTVYEMGGELHAWAGEPDSLYCLIHSESAYHVLCQLAGETPPRCLNKIIEWKDKDGKLHRDDGPAWIEPNGTQIWVQHGEYHRDDGPAVVEPDGTQLWYQDGKLHRDNGPAAIYEDGEQEWYQHGKRVPREQCIKP